MNKAKEILEFSGRLVIFLTLSLLIHLALLYYSDLPLFDNLILPSYLINFLLALVIYAALFLLQHKYSAQMGFLYMAGSFLKFAVFFIFFYPSYKSDGDVTGLEFAAFFTPYAISLIIETLAVIKFLKK